jgi:hypothetical protein
MLILEFIFLHIHSLLVAILQKENHKKFEALNKGENINTT